MVTSVKLGTPQKKAPQTCLQDCSLIAAAFERACYHDTTEESVFAPMYKQLENTKNFSGTAQIALSSYLVSPVSKTVDDLTSLGQGTVNIGTSEVPGGSLTSVSVGNNTKDYLSDLLGDTASNWLSNCIPCGDRILSLLELHPSLDFLGALRADVLARLKFITDMMSLLKNFDVYADYCKFFNILGEMCTADLAKLIVMFMALIYDLIPKQDEFGGMLSGLIGPIFMPVLTMITSLLDQLSLIVLSPIDCMIDHINAQIHKLYIQLDPQNPLQEMSGGLAELNKAIEQGKERIQQKLEFYIGQIKKLLEEEMAANAAYLEVSLKKLNYIRLIAFIVAIILALSKGQMACLKDGKSPKEEEIDDFFTNFLNPNVPYTFRLDPDGNMVIDEQIPGYDDVYSSPTSDPQGTQVNIDPANLAGLPTSVAEKVIELGASLTSTAEIVIPCKLKTSPGESAKIDRWIKELTQQGT